MPEIKAGSVSSQNVQGANNLHLTEAKGRRLLLKTDLVVMPLIILAMTLAFLDKVRASVKLIHEFAPSNTSNPTILTECTGIRRHLRPERGREPERPRVQLARWYLLLRIPGDGVSESLANDQSPHRQICWCMPTSLGHCELSDGCV